VIPKEKITSIVATDCGSTTTKAILIEKVGNEFRLCVRGEAPTTVEEPVADVTVGVMNAMQEVEELAQQGAKDKKTGKWILEPNPNRKILDKSRKAIMKPKKGDQGVDIYISTSSAGGGLQMMVAGVVKQMTAESAARAALGAGAIVMDTLATNDKRLEYQQIERIRNLRPDMILLSGGVDGGTIPHVVKLAELIAAADPRPRLGDSYNLPVIFAGNKDAREEIKAVLEKKCALAIAENLRPTLDRENLMPSRLLIQEEFLNHVMSHAPGYPNLMKLTDVPIMPTPGAVGNIMVRIANEKKIQVVGADIGGATTDVFSVFQGIYNKTVSANYGMSYSISNVFAETGLENVMRWVPFKMNERDLRNRVKNKMIRPTSIPFILEELVFEQAVAREALRLSFLQHKALAVGLRGVQRERTIGDALSQDTGSDSLVNLMGLNMLIGSGGVLSHAPRRSQAALMLMDSFAPEGITQLTVDSIFMMPQLGVLAEVHPEAATNVFEKDCLIYLGTCLAPVGKGTDGRPCMSVKITPVGGSTAAIERDVPYGKIEVVPLPVGAKAHVVCRPVRGFDMGAGSGSEVEGTVDGGEVGVIIDTRGRPLEIPTDESQRVNKLNEWIEAMNLYPRRLA